MRNDRLQDALSAVGITADTLAEELRVDPKTVERWITKGRVPYRRHRGRVAARLKTTEAYLWPDALTQEEVASASRSELVTFFPHRNSIPADLWDRLIEQASGQVDVLVHAGLFLVERPTFVKSLAEKHEAGCKIRLNFGDPASFEVEQRSEEERLGKGVLASRIRNALAFYRPLFGEGGPEIRFHRTTLYNSIFRFDDEVVVNTHVYGVQGAHAPAMHIRRIAGGNLFDTYAQGFQEVWDLSSPATLEGAGLEPS